MEIRVINQSDLTGEEANKFAIGVRRNQRFIITEHNHQQLQWNIPARTWNTDTDANSESFDQLNQFFKTMTPEDQQGLFDQYVKIHSILRSSNGAVTNCEDLIEALRPVVADLFSYIDPDKLYTWVWSSLNPHIPADIKTVFNPETMPGTRERTYLLEDYRGLIPFAIVVRAAVPFWFDFSTLTKSILSPAHKDMMTYSIIEQSWPALCAAKLRLEEFVDKTVGNERNDPVSIMAGIGSDDFVYWALSNLIITKVIVADVMGKVDLTPIAAALFNHIRHRVSSLKNSNPAIKAKTIESSSDTENNQSYLESFRNRLALTPGQEAVNSIYLKQQILNVVSGVRNPLSLVERIAPGMDYRLIKDALTSAKRLQNHFISEEQITIATWLFYPYSSPRAVGNFKKQQVIELLALAQAILLHLGMKEIAMLVTGQYLSTTSEQDTSYYIGDSISAMRSNERERYAAYFPLEQGAKNSKKAVNYVYEDVYELTRSLQAYEINCTFSDKTLASIQGNNPNRKCILRRDAVTMFMDYAKYIAERPSVRIDPLAVLASIEAQ